jgi:hypothetical protein
MLCGPVEAGGGLELLVLTRRGKWRRLGAGRKMKLAALDDPDLEPLWKDVGCK